MVDSALKINYLSICNISHQRSPLFSDFFGLKMLCVRMCVRACVCMCVCMCVCVCECGCGHKMVGSTVLTLGIGLLLLL